MSKLCISVQSRYKSDKYAITGRFAYIYDAKLFAVKDIEQRLKLKDGLRYDLSIYDQHDNEIYRTAIVDNAPLVFFDDTGIFQF